MTWYRYKQHLINLNEVKLVKPFQQIYDENHEYFLIRFVYDSESHHEIQYPCEEDRNSEFEWLTSICCK
jgi:hypothetical protein